MKTKDKQQARLLKQLAALPFQPMEIVPGAAEIAGAIAPEPPRSARGVRVLGLLRPADDGPAKGRNTERDDGAEPRNQQ